MNKDQEKRLTEKQKDVYRYLVSFINKQGYSPTVRELCKITGYSSPATIHDYLKQLKKKGYITYEETKSRTIRILKELK